MKTRIVLGFLSSCAAFSVVSFVLSGCLSEAFGDSILIAQDIGYQTVSIYGVEGGAAFEGFQIMTQAGAQSRHKVEGQELFGRNLTATEAFMNRIRYSMEFQIDSNTGLTVQNLYGPGGPGSIAESVGKRISLTGGAAEEFYGYMEKAGLAKYADIDRISIEGVSQRCEVLFDGKMHYSCMIDVHE